MDDALVLIGNRAIWEHRGTAIGDVRLSNIIKL